MIGARRGGSQHNINRLISLGQDPQRSLGTAFTPLQVRFLRPVEIPTGMV